MRKAALTLALLLTISLTACSDGGPVVIKSTPTPTPEVTVTPEPTVTPDQAEITPDQSEVTTYPGEDEDFSVKPERPEIPEATKHKPVRNTSTN